VQLDDDGFIVPELFVFGLGVILVFVFINGENMHGDTSWKARSVPSVTSFGAL
jgi:hypothetical protein